MTQASWFPATAFESYMLADDTARYPMTFLIRFAFQGEVDVTAFRSAMDLVTPLHPLLTARPHHSSGQWYWEPQVRTIPLDVAQFGQPLICPTTSGIQLQSQAGMRFWCRYGDGLTELTVQGHHACADGLGAVQFLFDVLAEYHRIQQRDKKDGESVGRHKKDRVIDPSLLAARGKADFSPPEPVSLATQIRGIATEATKLLVRQPERITGVGSASQPTRKPTVELAPLHALHLTRDMSDAYREVAKAHGVMANDLFLRDMFLTLVRWRELRGQPFRSRRWLRLTMPINLRTREQGNMSAANVISYAFITRNVEATKDPAALLASIHAETEAIKYWRLGGMFLSGVAAIQKVRLLRPLLRLPTCFSSIVLSNLGDVRHAAGSRLPISNGRIVAGNLIMESFAGAPPPRFKTHAAMVVSRYNGRFSLGLQTDDTLDTSSAERLLQVYASQMSESIRTSRAKTTEESTCSIECD